MNSVDYHVFVLMYIYLYGRGCMLAVVPNSTAKFSGTGREVVDSHIFLTASH